MGAVGLDDREQTIRTGYEKHVPALLAYVRRQVGGDQHKAEDIVQETLLRCWSKFDGDNHTMLRPWLFKVARNLVIDGYRRGGARPKEVDGTGWLEQEPAELDHIENILSSVVVSEALKALSPAHREAIYLTYFLGKTIEEASDALGIPPGTIKSRLFYGMRSLKLALQERGAGSPTAPAPASAAR
ncbi:sigma-70 family RNA polymerase sigma factor [Streptomyces sp. AK02-01A]|uniref:sigma-70 family RNA polymerase sigma factor n=1 Tax=Streptomyces sp. AK02-01A TaxID=3028648 RepID=UPI0029A622F9|nr:sigma-70 family RNA polymerase sigma factor [Streptomyces sp. AK02-01A]MDX3850998.1 sigma-70 family RNA polymerase sigma factor [Streptomyces sp. AK02-01A]